jgi:hypothetical protein
MRIRDTAGSKRRRPVFFNLMQIQALLAAGAFL